jgi:hypothetical protein
MTDQKGSPPFVLTAYPILTLLLQRSVHQGLAGRLVCGLPSAVLQSAVHEWLVGHTNQDAPTSITNPEAAALHLTPFPPANSMLHAAVGRGGSSKREGVAQRLKRRMGMRAWRPWQLSAIQAYPRRSSSHEEGRPQSTCRVRVVYGVQSPGPSSSASPKAMAAGFRCRAASFFTFNIFFWSL